VTSVLIAGRAAGALLFVAFGKSHGRMTVGLYRTRSLSRSVSETSVSGSGSDRAVRRKPVVRSGQDVWGLGFQPRRSSVWLVRSATDSAPKPWRVGIGPTPEAWSAG